MKRHSAAHTNDIETLAEDAKALLTATAGVAEDKVIEARKRLSVALEKGRETWERVQTRAVEGAKATDEAIHEHPYKAMAIAFGVGAVVALVLSRRH